MFDLKFDVIHRHMGEYNFRRKLQINKRSTKSCSFMMISSQLHSFGIIKWNSFRRPDWETQHMRNYFRTNVAKVTLNGWTMKNMNQNTNCSYLSKLFCLTHFCTSKVQSFSRWSGQFYRFHQLVCLDSDLHRHTLFYSSLFLVFSAISQVSISGYFFFDFFSGSVFFKTEQIFEIVEVRNAFKCTGDWACTICHIV